MPSDALNQSLVGGSPSQSIERTTQQRLNEYGDWREDGALADKLIEVVEHTPRWAAMPRHLRQAIRMILVKVSRLCCGNPHNRDSWHDIQGYAKIAEERTGAVQTKTSTQNFVGEQLLSVKQPGQL